MYNYYTVEKSCLGVVADVIMKFVAELGERSCIEEAERQVHFQNIDYLKLENITLVMKIEDDIMKDIFMQETFTYF